MSAVWASPLYWIVGLVACQRLCELVYAQRNTSRLLAEGGEEAGARHYPLMVLLHGGWLAAMALAIDPATPVNLSLLAAFLALQGARLWVVATLGKYWTTRVITLPGAPLVERGPYRFLRHPNYVVVVAEIAVLPLVFGAWVIAALFSALNLVLLVHRVRVENAVLETRRGTATSGQGESGRREVDAGAKVR